MVTTEEPQTKARRPGPGVVRLLRPRQWTKNLLVLAAPAAAGVLFDPAVAIDVLGAFAAMSLAASSVYVFNDLLDRERDRHHVEKRHRPIASGAVSLATAIAVGSTFAVGALLIAIMVDPLVATAVLLYQVLMGGYSLRLKHIAIIDVMIIASGFVLRAMIGGFAADVPLSSWFLIVTSAGSFFIAVGKRRAEALDMPDDASTHRPSLADYDEEMNVFLLTLSAGVAIVAYCIWALEDGARIFTSLSIIPFVYSILHYGSLSLRGMAGEPEQVILNDRRLLTGGAAWLALFLLDVYMPFI